MRRSGDHDRLRSVCARRAWLGAIALALSGRTGLAQTQTRTQTQTASASGTPDAAGTSADRAAQPDRARSLRVVAPVSLREALEASLEGFARRQTVSLPSGVYGGTPALIRQLQQGLEADLVITADELWMDRLQAEGRILTQTRQLLIRNRLVLIAPLERGSRPSSLASTANASITARGDAASASGARDPSPRELDATLRERLARGRLAVADVQTVPAGRYAREALQWAQWEALTQGRLAQTEHVRAALRLVARGEASLGIVYATDALAEPRVQVLYRFPSQAHADIRVPIAQLAPPSAPNAAHAAQVRSLLEWLTAPHGRAAFLSRGFVAP